MTDVEWSRPPGDDVVEVAVFGPGKGESVLVHLGYGSWLVVDSCVDLAGASAPLAYLDSIGVARDSIEMVLASHWHDDHIAGLSQVVQSAPSARFACSQALQTDEFLNLVAAADLRPMVRATSGVREFGRVLAVLTETNRKPAWAGVDRLLISRTDPCVVRAHALSPSDAAMTESFHRFGELLRMQDDPNRRSVPRPERNPAAVVLHLTVGNATMLLCSDLEIDRDTSKGPYVSMIGETGLVPGD